MAEQLALVLGVRKKYPSWQRTANLRLAPVRPNMGQIDNVDAAKAFTRSLCAAKNQRLIMVNSLVLKITGSAWQGWCACGRFDPLAREKRQRIAQINVGLGFCTNFIRTNLDIFHWWYTRLLQ